MALNMLLIAFHFAHLARKADSKASAFFFHKLIRFNLFTNIT